MRRPPKHCLSSSQNTALLLLLRAHATLPCCCILHSLHGLDVEHVIPQPFHLPQQTLE